MDAPAAAFLTPGNVEAYIAELKDRVGSVTVYGSIFKLRRTAQLIAPAQDVRWLAEIEKDLALVMRPRSKFDRMVLAEVLVEAGLTLLAEAEAATSRTSLSRARQFRNGLMVALLGFCPIRLKNFTALEIGRSFAEIKGRWWIVLSASQTKENRPDERPVDELLKPGIDRYLAHYRPILMARSGSPSSALWLSSNDGAPMRYSGVELTIKTTTLSTVGVDVSPHLFRTSGASSAATHAHDNPHLGSALLHHKHSGVTNAHYNRAPSMSAADSLRQIVRRYEKNGLD
jgi:integrase